MLLIRSLQRMLEWNSLTLLLRLVCLFCLNGHHGAYGFYPYGGYGSSGAYQQQQQAAANEAYSKSKSSGSSSAGAQQYGFGYDGFGYPLQFGYHPVAATGAHNQQQQSADDAAYSKSQSASQSSAGTGHYGAFVPPAVGYPTYYVKPFDQSDSASYRAPYSAQSISRRGDVRNENVGNIGGRGAAQSLGVSGNLVSSSLNNHAGGGPYRMSAVQKVTAGGVIRGNNIFNRVYGVRGGRVY